MLIVPALPTPIFSSWLPGAPPPVFSQVMGAVVIIGIPVILGFIAAFMLAKYLFESRHKQRDTSMGINPAEDVVEGVKRQLPGSGLAEPEGEAPESGVNGNR